MLGGTWNGVPLRVQQRRRCSHHRLRVYLTLLVRLSIVCLICLIVVLWAGVLGRQVILVNGIEGKM